MYWGWYELTKNNNDSKWADPPYYEEHEEDCGCPRCLGIDPKEMSQQASYDASHDDKR